MKTFLAMKTYWLCLLFSLTSICFAQTPDSVILVAVNDTISINANISAQIFVLDNESCAGWETDSDCDFVLEGLTILSITQPANGAIEFDFGNDFLLYVPNPNFVGVDTCQYTVTNALGQVATAYVICFVGVPPNPCAFTSPSCGTYEACQAICNPSFCPPDSCSLNGGGCIIGWDAAHGTPDGRVNGWPDAPSAGYAEMWTNSVNASIGEGIITNVTIIPNQDYYFSYYREKRDKTPAYPSIDNIYVRLIKDGNGSSPTGSFVIPNYNAIDNQIIVHEQNVVGENVERVVACFTADDSYDKLVLYPEQNSGNPLTRLLVDQIEVTSVPPSTSKDITIACGENVDLTVEKCTLSGATWTWFANDDSITIGETITVSPQEATTYTAVLSFDDNTVLTCTPDVTCTFNISLDPVCNPCDFVNASYENVVSTTDSCCYTISIQNDYQDDFFKGIQLTSLDDTKFWYVGTGGWAINAFSSNNIEISPTQTNTIPTGTNESIVKICLYDYSDVPQEVALSWLIPDGDDCKQLCTDTLQFDCELDPNPKCVFVAEDTIFCTPNQEVKYRFKVTNNTSPGFDIERLFVNHSPNTIDFSPNNIAIPRLPFGATSDFIEVDISTANAGDTLCFTMIGVAPAPSFECCTDTMLHCVIIPTCVNPCDVTYPLVTPVDEVTDSCCYNISIVNNYTDDYFKGVEVRSTDNTKMWYAGTNGWILDDFSSQHAIITPANTPFVPTGNNANVLKVCLYDYTDVPQQLALNWLVPTDAGTCEAVCTDVLEFDCDLAPEPKCLVVADDNIYCDGESVKYQFKVTNNTSPNFDVNRVFVNHAPNSVGFTPNNIPIPLLSYGATSDFLEVDITNANPGDTVCFTMIAVAPAPSYECCTDSTLHCVVIPNCANPCNDVSSSYEAVPEATDTCCYTISIQNDFDANYFKGIQITSLDDTKMWYAGTNGWSLDEFSNQHAIVSPTDKIPMGTSEDIIKVCLYDYTDFPQQLQLDWLVIGSNEVCEAVCSDTLVFECTLDPEPKCLTIAEDEIYCDGNNIKYQFKVTNNTSPNFEVDRIFINHTPSAIGFDPTNIDIPLLGFGQTSDFIEVDLSSATPGDTLCFTMIAVAPAPSYECCTDTLLHCVIIPNCGDPCEEINVTYEHVDNGADTCCYTISLQNDYDDDYFKGLQISSLDDTKFSYVGTSNWAINDFSSQYINISPTATDFIPTGSINNVVKVCIYDYTDFPQLLQLDWLIEDGNENCEAVCSDTLVFECQLDPDPKCVFVAEDEIYCDGENVKYKFKVTNNTSPSFDIERVMINHSPSNIGFTSNNITIPLLGFGETSDFLTVDISNANPSDTLCFSMIGVAPAPSFECCTDTTLHCVIIPDCTLPVDTGCVEVVEDTIYCQGGTYKYEFTVVNNANFPIRRLEAFYDPSDAVFAPTNIQIPALAPGDTSDIITINVNNIDVGENMCFTLAGRESGNPSSQSCTNNVPHCFEIPDCTTTGFNEPIGIERLNVYPNPVENSITLSWSALNQTGNINIKLMDIYGKLIQTFTTSANKQQFTTDVSNLPNGLYLITLESRINSSSIKFIKQ